MSSSDVRMLEELTARVAALEARVGLLGEQLAALRQAQDKLAGLLPRDVSGELYGAEPDHAADREARAAMVKRPRSLP